MLENRQRRPGCFALGIGMDTPEQGGDLIPVKHASKPIKRQSRSRGCRKTQMLLTNRTMRHRRPLLRLSGTLNHMWTTPAYKNPE